MNKLEHSPAPVARNHVGTDRTHRPFFSPSEGSSSFSEALLVLVHGCLPQRG